MNVTVITAEGCSHCGSVLTQLRALQSEFPDMEVQTLDISSDEGQRLIATHGILGSPGVLIDGTLAFYGPRSTEEIRKFLRNPP